MTALRLQLARDDKYWACTGADAMPSRIAWLDGYDLRALSGDGTQILVRGSGGRGRQRRGGGYGQLYLADVITERLRPVADWYPQELIGAAGFSPDGLRIAFQSVSRDDDRVLQTWVLELEAGEARCVSRRRGGFELGVS